MSASANIVLRKKPNAKGLYPLAIRITKNRRSSYKLIGHYIEIEEWDERNNQIKRSHPNAEDLNNLLYSKLSETKKGLIILQTKNKDASAYQIKKEIYRPTSSLTFFDFAKEHLETLESEEKLNRLSADSAWISYIHQYCKSKQLSFQEIDERFLKNLKTHLKIKQSLSETTVMNVFVLIRLLFNRAIKNKVVSKELYPFGGDKFKIKFPETIKIGLSERELMILENTKKLSSRERHSLNIWLYSFYFAGMRVSDVLLTRWSQIYDGRLHYRMGKNGKLLSLKIPSKVHKILKQYIGDKNHENDFVFPEMKKADLSNAKDVFNKLKTVTKKFNDSLKKIAVKNCIRKKVTMHIARHSFGNIARDKIHPLMLQKLYRHSGLKTTINYQANFIHKEADEALENVIDF